jgi:PKD repeat protein
MKQKLILFATGIALASGLMSSCSEDTPAPTAVIYATIVDYTVTFAPQVTDVSTYSWDFGDGTALSTEPAPVHTYASFGDYTVKLTVKGDGGEAIATKVITIAATSIKDLLTGGAKATNGKTWVLDRAYTVGDGGGPIMPAPYLVVQASATDVLCMVGSDAVCAEYDNEFTFYFDGTYKMKPVNGNVLSGAVYAYGTNSVVGDPAWAVGLAAATFTPPATSTWTENNTSFTIDAIQDPNDPNVPPAHAVVTFPAGTNPITFSEGAYFGVNDFPTTRRFIIDKITTTKLTVSMFVCGYGFDGGSPVYNTMPSNMFHLTYVAK